MRQHAGGGDQARQGGHPASRDTRQVESAEERRYENERRAEVRLRNDEKKGWRNDRARQHEIL
jgi:hypothetical protein